MSTNTPTSTIESADGRPLQPADSLNGFLYNLFLIASSMWVTMVLLVVAIFLIFCGTLAQAVREKPWEFLVVKEYFRGFWVWIEWRIFFPETYFPNMKELPRGQGFPFPGGWTIGFLLLANLVLSVGSRIRLAKGTFRRVLGGVVTLTGVACVTLVIYWNNLDGEGASAIDEQGWNLVWYLFLTLTGALWVGAVVTIIIFTWLQVPLYRKTGKVPVRASSLWTLLLVVVVTLSIFLLWALASLTTAVEGENFRLHDSSMRILWLLMETTFAGCWLLLGAQLLFARKGASVIIHCGIIDEYSRRRGY